MGIEIDRSIVQIDEHKLDRECIRLPSDYLKAANLAADARQKLAELEREADVVEAECSKRVRDHPGKHGLEKVTEASLREVVAMTEEYQTARRRVDRARYDLELVQALVSAMDHKKRALTLLVNLHGMGYFANPRVSAKGREAVEDESMRRFARPRKDD